MSLFRSSLKLLTLFALLAAIALQPVAVAVSSMLGQRHLHREPVASAKIWLGMAGNWHGTPRAVRTDTAATATHAHLHSLGLRHHHDIDDRSVVALEPLAGDGSPADGSPSPTASFAFVADRGVELQSAMATSATDWQKLELLPMQSQPPRRIERPPRPIA